MAKQIKIQTFVNFEENGTIMSDTKSYTVDIDEVDTWLGTIWRCFARERKAKKYIGLEIEIKIK